jgi:hypothetical protein
MSKIKKGDLVKLTKPSISFLRKKGSIGIVLGYSNILQRWKIGWGYKNIYVGYHHINTLEKIS